MFGFSFRLRLGYRLLFGFYPGFGLGYRLLLGFGLRHRFLFGLNFWFRFLPGLRCEFGSYFLGGFPVLGSTDLILTDKAWAVGIIVAGKAVQVGRVAGAIGQAEEEQTDAEPWYQTQQRKRNAFEHVVYSWRNVTCLFRDGRFVVCWGELVREMANKIPPVMAMAAPTPKAVQPNGNIIPV